MKDFAGKDSTREEFTRTADVGSSIIGAGGGVSVCRVSTAADGVDCLLGAADGVDWSAFHVMP